MGWGLALELYRRHPAVARSLILVSAYAGWGGSLPAEVVKERHRLMLRNSQLPPEDWAPALIGTLLTDRARPELVDELESIIAEFHPAATRVALGAFAEADLRDVLPHINVPTLLGGDDVRSPRHVWEPLHSSIPGSELVVIPGVGHMINMEAAERCNAEMCAFLRTVQN